MDYFQPWTMPKTGNPKSQKGITTDYADSTDEQYYFFLIRDIGVIRGS
jgi:hypothetical protein